ncbi:substrate-binding periplasmic protein [Spartinivicinus ruber]|uniref:substrate-binding periplasmic protein n=1 Tax=Spartinivicinus ruber TaxID=2683272 RepID=UPI0013D4C7EC|nr:transporter substrate-binding domain-containing protein [Spartinivicinus ruber]
MKLIVLAYLLSTFFSSVHAKTYTVGLVDWPPFAYVDNQSIRGISVEIVQEVSKRTGITIKIVEFPWARLMVLLEGGKVDGIAFVAKNKERERYILYPEEPYYTLTTVFYVRKGDRDQVQTYNDLYRLGVGVVRGSEYFDPFNNDPKITKTEVVKEIQLLQMLDKGRVGVIVGTHPQVEAQIAQHGFTEKFEQAVYHPGNDAQIYFGLSRKSALASYESRITEAIRAMKKDGLIQKISKKYLK